MTRVRFAPAPKGFLHIGGLMINGSRAALSGQPVGPGTFAIFPVLGKERVVRRLRRV